jgi:hypothetical protein
MHDNDEDFWPEHASDDDFCCRGTTDDNLLELKEGSREDYFPCDAWTGLTHLSEADRAYLGYEPIHAADGELVLAQVEKLLETVPPEDECANFCGALAQLLRVINGGCEPE